MANKPTFNNRTKTWVVELRSTYPRIIQDERSNEVMVRYLDLRDLGAVKFNENLEITDATSLESCEQQLVSRLNLWRNQSEQIVLKASSEVFGKIAEGEHVLNPIVEILDRLAKCQGKFTISEEEISDQPRPSKKREYLQLLEELEIVKKIDDGYTYGSMYVGILEGAKSKGLEPQTALISYVIERKYSTLRQVYGIAQLEPYVKLANSFYWPCLDVEKLIHTTRNRLIERLRDYYGKPLTWGIDLKLSQLIKQGAFLEENGYLTGDKTRFEQMIEMKHASVSLNP
jgi:hypothetical protein